MQRQRPNDARRDPRRLGKLKPTPSSQHTTANGALTADWIAPLIEPHLRFALAALDEPAPLLGGMARYHLGWLNGDLTPATDPAAARGKLIRPLVAVLCCAAAGGEPARAAPLAAAVELLHNFTLVHDDIQDESPSRRHRATTWRLWGIGQAINAGDALFAAAHLPLYRLREYRIDPDLTVRLAVEFDRMTITIVQGQVLDLEYEGAAKVTADQYLEMIGCKTAAIVRYAAWAGALVGGTDEATAERFSAFGLALGLGFQIRDDVLGIWGTAAATGKAAADDIRRRKQSLPILLLREQANPTTREELARLYQQPEIDDAGVARVLELLAAAGIRRQVEKRIAIFHREARDLLMEAAKPGPNAARDALLGLVESLAMREM